LPGFLFGSWLLASAVAGFLVLAILLAERLWVTMGKCNCNCTGCMKGDHCKKLSNRCGK
jgi:hypothetical protein